MRIRAIYAADDAFRRMPPAQRQLLRAEHLLPLMEGFFAWVKQARATAQGRDLATKALGYAFNQEQQLLRVLEDGRLPLDNTRSERSLRKIVVGRKNWVFYGSDTHAESAAAIFSIIASCRLHAIDRSSTQVVVTANLRDFDPLPDGIEAQSPDEFLCDLFDLDPDGFVELLREQAADLVKPPITFDQLLDRLERVAPELATAVRQRLKLP